MVQGPPSQMVEVEACLDPAAEEGHRETQEVVGVVEVPSQVRVEGVVVLTCQGGAGVAEVQACLVKEVEEEEEEYRRDPVKEEGVAGRGCLRGLEGVGVEEEVEGAYLHSGQGAEGREVEGANLVLAQGQ